MWEKEAIPQALTDRDLGLQVCPGPPLLSLPQFPPLQLGPMGGQGLGQATGMMPQELEGRAASGFDNLGLGQEREKQPHPRAQNHLLGGNPSWHHECPRQGRGRDDFLGAPQPQVSGPRGSGTRLEAQ